MIRDLTRYARWQFPSRFFGDCAISIVVPADDRSAFKVEIVL